MPNWSSVEAGFLQQTRPYQLGELASCFARIKAWCSEIESARFGVPIILSESLLYLSLLIKQEVHTSEFIQLHQLVLSWQQRWSAIISKPDEIDLVIATSASNTARLRKKEGERRKN
jgi:hypothetical protein